MKKILLLLISFISFGFTSILYVDGSCPDSYTNNGITYYKNSLINSSTSDGYSSSISSRCRIYVDDMLTDFYYEDGVKIYYMDMEDLSSTYSCSNLNCIDYSRYRYASAVPVEEPNPDDETCVLGKNEFLVDGKCDKTCSEYSGNPNAYANCICGQIGHDFYEDSKYSTFVGEKDGKCYDVATGLQCLNFAGEPFGDFGYVIGEVSCNDSNTTVPDYNATLPSTDDNETLTDDNITNPDDNSTIPPIDNNSTSNNSTNSTGNSTNDNGTTSINDNNSSGSGSETGGNNNGTGIEDNNGTDNATDDCWWCGEGDTIDSEALGNFITSELNNVVKPLKDLMSIIESKNLSFTLPSSSNCGSSFSILGKTMTFDMCSHIGILSPIIQLIVTICGYVVAIKIFFGGMK